MRHASYPTRSPRPTVEQVLSEARRAVASARAQRDRLELALEQAERENVDLRREIESRPPPAAPAVEFTQRQQTVALERMRIDTLTAAVEPMAELIDHLGRSLAAHPDPESPWFAGTAAVLARTRSSLAGLGVHTVGAIGDAFDPELHEALGTLPTDDLPPGSIVDIVKTGLATESGVLIRPASVVVSERGVR